MGLKDRRRRQNPTAGPPHPLMQERRRANLPRKRSNLKRGTTRFWETSGKVFAIGYRRSTRWGFFSFGLNVADAVLVGLFPTAGKEKIKDAVGCDKDHKASKDPKNVKDAKKDTKKENEQS